MDGPVHLSAPHVSGETPRDFFPSIDFFPYKVFNHRMFSCEERQVTVRVVGVAAGKLKFAVHFHFCGKVSRSCSVSAVVLPPDGNEILDFAASDIRLQRTVRNVCYDEARDRLRTLLLADRERGVVRGPKMKR